MRLIRFNQAEVERHKRVVHEKSKELLEAQQPLRQLESAESSLKAEEKEKDGKRTLKVGRFRVSGTYGAMPSPLPPPSSRRVVHDTTPTGEIVCKALHRLRLGNQWHGMAWLVCLFSFSPEEKKRVSDELKEAREEAKRSAASEREKVLHDNIQQVM